MTEWSDLKEKVLGDCLKKLKALGLEYAIIHHDGTVLGTLSVEQKKERKKRISNKYGHMELKNHVSPIISDMQPGDERKVPMLHFDPQALQSSVASAAFHMWGPKSYVTSRVNVDNCVSIMRIS